MPLKFKSKKETFNIPETFEINQENLENISLRGNILIEFMHEITSAPTEERMLKLISDYCFKLFEIDGLAVFFPNESRKYLIPRIIKTKDPEMLKRAAKLDISKKMSVNTRYSTARAYLSQKTVVVQKTLIPSLKKIGIKTVVALPLIANESCIGVLSLGFGKIYVPDQSDLKIGEMLSLHSAVNISNLRLVQSLQLQNSWMQTVQENIKEGFSLIGADDIIYYTNKLVSKLFGTTARTIGLKRGDLVKNWEKTHRFRVERLFDDQKMQKAVYQNHEPFLNGLIKVLSSPERLVEANYYPVLQNKEFLGVAASYRDVTKEKFQDQVLDKQMQKLKSEKERFEAIIENVEEGICLVDGNLKIIHMNNTCESASGWTLNEVKGEFYHKVFKCHTKNGLFHPDFDPLKKILVTKEPLPYDEHLHTSRSGEESWVGISAAPIFNSNGEVEEIVLVIRDISALKQIEKVKSEFVSIASHELRTPLTVINGYLTLLKDGDLGDFTTLESREKLKEVLNTVTSETNRLTNLVSDLLNVSRIEENRIILNKRLESISKIVNNALDKMKSLAKDKSIKLYLKKTDPDGLLINCDVDKINQVLINLIDNSMKFTKTKGEISIDYWQKGSKVFVCIEDTGIGMPQKLLPIIFEKFQQLPGSYLKENRGTGLGLFIVKSLIDMHGGEIFVESKLNKGTKITFSLPL